VHLKRFKVSNYRSIRSTPLIKVSTNLTIIGPNNEGKSNLVRALVTGLELLEEHASGPRRMGAARLSLVSKSRAYEWVRDFPIDRQEKLTLETEFKLEFHLDESDRAEFSRELGSHINDNLPITIRIGRSQVPEFVVNKPGKGFGALTKKSSEIAAFIGSKLSINYIPAVRTAGHSARSVELLVSSALRRVERTDEYREAMKTIEELQRPVLDDLEQRLKGSLKTFIPSVHDVTLQISGNRNSSMRSVEIGIDDGRLTPLASKGDGIISLVGMALLSRIDSLASEGINLILAIEEPESHLHPRAIHSIRSILDQIGGEVQVIITTHSPALVNRISVSENIIVQDSKARPASNVAEIRDVLGVRVSDNLTNSRISIICEGKNDKKAIARILCDLYPELVAPIENGEISFNGLGGGGNLSYEVSAIQNSICEPVCFLDDDKAGHQAFVSAQADGLLSDSDVVFTKRLGKVESEFEDLIDDKVVAEYLDRIHKVTLENLPAGLKKKKFSERAEGAFTQCGRLWNNNVKSKIKSDLSEICATNGLNCLDPARVAPLNTLGALVVERLSRD
jgi:putative ATP-dependent endonuclease of the OLD family